MVSIRANVINPPSKIGIGSKFIINNEMLIKAKKFRTVTKPVEKLAENPATAVSPIICVILIGPETADVKSTPLNKSPILLKVKPIVSTVSKNPCLIEPKNP